jgi:hypothetical protein
MPLVIVPLVVVIPVVVISVVVIVACLAVAGGPEEDVFPLGFAGWRDRLIVAHEVGLRGYEEGSVVGREGVEAGPRRA